MDESDPSQSGESGCCGPDSSTTPDRDPGAFDHLFAEPVRASLEGDGYGSWRSISAPDAVSLSFGFPFTESFPRDGLAESVDEILRGDGHSALQYGGGEYVTKLNEHLARRARDRGVDCDADNVLVTNGATNAIDVVAHTFLDPDDTVFVEAPTFMGTLKLFENYGVDVEGFTVDDDGLDVDAVADALETRRQNGDPIPKFVYTIPTFQNPTGTTLTRERREKLLDLAAEYDFLIVEDDAYGELYFGDEPTTPLAALDETGRVIHLGTFSKTIAPGVRTGWVIADERLKQQVRRIAAGGTNTFTLSMIGRYFENGHYEPTVDDLRAAYAERCDHMLSCLDEHMPEGATWTEPTGGFFIWVELPDGIDADEILPEAAEEGVTYLAGSHFYADDRASNGLRLSFSYASFEEMDRGVAALARATKAAME